MYHLGKDSIIFVNGRKADLVETNNRFFLPAGAVVSSPHSGETLNDALNIGRRDDPVPSASVNTEDTSIYQAIDGRNWYFTEITNCWTILGSAKTTDWYSLVFGKEKETSSVRVSFLEDSLRFSVPPELTINCLQEGKWVPVKQTDRIPAMITGNTVNRINFTRWEFNKNRQLKIALSSPADGNENIPDCREWPACFSSGSVI